MEILGNSKAVMLKLAVKSRVGQLQKISIFSTWGNLFLKKVHPLDITVTRLVGKPNNLDNFIQQQS